MRSQLVAMVAMISGDLGYVELIHLSFGWVLGHTMSFFVQYDVGRFIISWGTIMTVCVLGVLEFHME